MAKHKSRGAIQFAALPWRISESGVTEILLLTSRETGRWVIPKGWPMKARRGAEVAAIEAYEEAGLIGQVVSKRPIGNFHYEKQLFQETALCEVRVYSFKVESQLADWPERRQRTTTWFVANEAASLVDEGGLAEIIINFAQNVISLPHFGKPRRSRRSSERLADK